MFRHTLELHVQSLAKSDSEKERDGTGMMADRYPFEWVVIVDKGYKAFCIHFFAISLNMKQCGENLPIPQMHDPVIVGNIIGRLCSFWTDCLDKYPWAMETHDMFFQLCVVLTNAHARLNPLRAENGETMGKNLAHLTLIREDMQARRADAQRVYRECQQPRLRTMFQVQRESSDYASFKVSDSDIQEEANRLG